MSEKELRANPLSTRYLVLLHLLPFVIVFVNLLVYRRLVAALGLPPLYGSILLWITNITVELGFLLHLGKKLNGRLTLKGIVLYRQPLPWWRHIVFIETLSKKRDLTGADLSGLDLSGMKLLGVKMTGANLRDANLTSSILAGADISRADLSNTQLTRAKILGGNMEDSVLHPEKEATSTTTASRVKPSRRRE